jgi:NTP pyrophosphatase (non-canonical NTP hydrolase)
MTEIHDIKYLSDKMDEFVKSKSWYSAKSPRPQTPRNMAISLALETAEVLEHYQWGNQCHNIEELAGELADVALYLFQLARLEKIDLESAILTKLDVNSKRKWE